MKTDLNDLTFLIPIRIDSMIRLENALAVITYLRRRFNTRIMVLEANRYNSKILQKLLPKDVEYYFIEDKDPVFYRTYYLNWMTSKVQTDYLAIWDADIIIPPNQILDAITQLRIRQADIAFPYSGIFLDASEIIRMLFITTQRLSVLTRNKDKMKPLYSSPNMKGGAILVNVEKYKKAGMENERFYGWGPEDFERYERWFTLGYKIYRTEGCLYHLSHPRDMNGKYNSRQQMKDTSYELSVTRSSSAEEILERMGRTELAETGQKDQITL